MDIGYIKIALLSVTLVYMSTLAIIYFRQKHIESEELQIFNKLLLVNILGLTIETCLILACKLLTVENITTIILSRLFLVTLLYFITLMVIYIRYMAGLKKKKKFTIATFIMIFIVTVLVITLPIDWVDLTADYCTGPAVTVLYVYGIFSLIYSITVMLLNVGKLKTKKCLPLIIFFIGLFVGSVIQRLNPRITITTLIDAFTLFIMYFTVENPDIKIMSQLEKARDEANRANRAKSDFLSSMSHEIRTPLNAIIGFSEFIIDTPDIEEAHSQAKDVVSASQTLLETVNGILDLSKVESGKLEIINDNYNVRDLLDSTVKMAKARLGDKKLDLRVHFAEDLPDTLYGDKGNLNKVLINLLTNAIKYTNEGYIDYSVQCAKNNDTCRLFITVKDTGIGIKKENIDKLFTRFQRFDEKNNGTIEGTGLGLAITKQLVEMMGGNIVVSSIYGEGSSFSVALDQGLSSVHVESKQENTQETVEFDFHDKRILVVDDNNLNLKLADRIFAKYNCKPKLVKSGFECLDLVNKGEKFDLILLDDVMPKMLGSETLTRLKRIENFDTPVVALTANAVSGMKEKYLLLGFDDYLAKPIERDQLSIILKKFLVNNTKAKKLDETQLTSSRPAEIVTETVKENILNSASSKDVFIVEKENDKSKTITIEKKVEDSKPEIKEEKKEEVKEETKEETKEEVKTSNNNIKVSLPDSEEFTDYSGRRVLVVDDNKLNLKVALKFLSRYKFEEDEAYSGEECLNKIKSGEKYDIIFMDIMMPNMNGVETFHALQKIEGFNTPVVVALTADAVEGAQERYLGEGFAEYISKPIVRERLDKVIHEVLDGKE